MLKVDTKKSAWELANRLFPTDYELDGDRSRNAGYMIYYTTNPEMNAWISDLGDRLELNYPNGSSENIWIESQNDNAGLTLMEFLKVMDKDTFVSIGVTVCGIKFEARHSAEYFIEQGDTLNNKKIQKAYMDDCGLHIRLEN